MTQYLADTRARLLDRFEELPDVQENYQAFCGIADLIQWIDENPQASREQYLAAVQSIKSGCEEPRHSRLDMVRERARRMA